MYRKAILILLVLFRVNSIAQTNIENPDSIGAPIDSFQQLIHFYDSLSPDSQFLEILANQNDSLLEDSLAIDSTIEVVNREISDERLVPTTRASTQKAWVFILMLIICLLVGIVRYINVGIHDHFIRDIFVFKEMHYDDEPRTDISNIILVFFFIIQSLIFSFGIFAFTNYDSLFTLDNSILDYLLVFTIVVVGFLFKYFAYKFTADVLVIQKFSKVALSFLVPAGYLLSLLLLPLFAIKYYNHSPLLSNYSIYLILGLIAIYILIRSVKILIGSYRNFSFNKIYLFIYLCTVEILPAILIWNLLLNFTN